MVKKNWMLITTLKIKTSTYFPCCERNLYNVSQHYFTFICLLRSILYLILPWNDICDTFTTIHQLLLTDVICIVRASSLTCGNALSGGGRSVLGRVFQPLNHLPLHGGRNSVGGRVPQCLGCPLQCLLARWIRSIGAYGLRSLNHLGSSVGQFLSSRQKPLLWLLC